MAAMEMRSSAMASVEREHAHAVGHAIAQKRQHAQGEGDIGCHGDGQPLCAPAWLKIKMQAGTTTPPRPPAWEAWPDADS